MGPQIGAVCGIVEVEVYSTKVGQPMNGYGQRVARYCDSGLWSSRKALQFGRFGRQYSAILLYGTPLAKAVELMGKAA